MRNIRVLLEVFRQDIRQDCAGDGVLNADMDEMRAAEAVAGALLILLLELEDLLCGLQKLLPVRREAERTAAHEQRCPQFLLKLRYLLGQRLLRNEQMFRGYRKALLVGHGSEAFQQ